MPSGASYLHKNVSLLEVNDPAVLDQLFADRKTAEFLLVRLSDLVALVDTEKLDALYTRLRKLDHMPKVIQSIP
jgi:hypothetical protein